MITIRQIFTEEMFNYYNKTMILSDLAFIACYDTYKALSELTKSEYFGPFFSDSLSFINSYSFSERLNEILKNPPEFITSICVADIANVDLINEFYTTSDLKLISNNKLIILLNHFDLLEKLTNFNKTYYFLLRIAASLAKIEISKELENRGISIT